MKEYSQVEIERKYIIKMPDLDSILGIEGSTKSSILQIYLPSKKGETHRIRRREYDDRTVCTETKKIRIDNMSAEEIEREISPLEFGALALNIMEGTAPIDKVRYTFSYKDQLFEIDVYPQWHHTAIMETELDSRITKVEIPSFIEIVREVTGDKAYSNAAMSKSFPVEDRWN